MKKKNISVNTYKDRGHLLQKHSDALKPADDRGHLLQGATSPEDVALEDRGHFLQRNG